MLHSLAHQRHYQMSFGPQITPTGVRFRFWAPKAEAVELKIVNQNRARHMRCRDDGWHELEVEGAGPGTLYQFVLPDGLHVPDPASRFQPNDVHGPSEVIDAEAYRWTETEWHGRPWEECVLYELHLGAFTPEGTFRAAAERLDELAELGVTAIELMPIADFPATASPRSPRPRRCVRWRPYTFSRRRSR